MIKVFDIRPFVMLLINFVMIFVLYSLNDLLSFSGIYLIVPVLFLVVPAVYLNTAKAMFVICATALAMESLLPVRAFSILVIWLLAGFFLRTQRFRFVRMGFAEIFLLLAILNTLMIFSYGIFFFSSNMDFLAYAFKIFNDAFFSVLFLIYTSSYVIFLHRAIFNVLGLELSVEKAYLC
ncbi:MAG: hypothetical protein R3Y46_05475 [Opitutales bacterium]